MLSVERKSLLNSEIMTHYVELIALKENGVCRVLGSLLVSYINMGIIYYYISTLSILTLRPSHALVLYLPLCHCSNIVFIDLIIVISRLFVNQILVNFFFILRYRLKRLYAISITLYFSIFFPSKHFIKFSLITSSPIYIVFVWREREREREREDVWN